MAEDWVKFWWDLCWASSVCWAPAYILGKQWRPGWKGSGPQVFTDNTQQQVQQPVAWVSSDCDKICEVSKTGL